MQRRAFFHAALGLAAGTVVLAGCGRRQPRLPRIDGNGVILAFGDSLTFGTGAAPEQSYPAALERLTLRHVVRSGVPGETAAQGSSGCPKRCAKPRRSS